MVSGTTISHCHRAGDEVGEALRPAQAAVDDFAAVQALDASTTHRLAILVEELITNVLCHCDHQRDIALKLELEHGRDGLFIVLEDDSAPFDPRSVSLPEMPNAERGGGVGLALVKAWTDIVAYDSENGRNHLVLRFLPPRGSKSGRSSDIVA